MSIPSLLTDKVVTITGGLTGISRDIAISFVPHGAKVAINFPPSHNNSGTTTDGELIALLRNEAFTALEFRVIMTTSSRRPQSATKIPTLFVPGDISDPATSESLISQTVSHFTRLDIFVSNAGHLPV